jgi:dsDNA-specific endonuclease/ATPase MutS2
VRDFLASHPLVKSFRSGGHDEGGDGATIVRL